MAFAKRRGFIFPSSEIYGGFASSYDYGPLGVELKNNIKRLWWRDMVRKHENVAGLDAAILMSPKIWQASGHLGAGFADLLVECKSCHQRFREDHLAEKKCPNCGGQTTEAKKFNLLMKTFVGPVEDEASLAYLRGETCQGIYVNFKNVWQAMRLKIPFGIAQIGKAFRNEITPGNFIFRMREFEQMEMQFFIRPEESAKWFDYWKEERMRWYLDLGIKKENLRFREQRPEELAHYAQAAVDIEYQTPFGWKELEGIHNRGDWDLKNHSQASGDDLSYLDEESGERFLPHVIETSAGADRSALVFLLNAYEEIGGGRTTTTKSAKEMEVILRLHPSLAPVRAAILPLLHNKGELVKKAKEIFHSLQSQLALQYDEGGSIGRRYRRQDEIGTPFCVTVDFQTLEDETVTVRERDSMNQERFKIADLLKRLLAGGLIEINF